MFMIANCSINPRGNRRRTPKPQEVEQHLCLDKGYDNPTSQDAVDKHKYIPHIRRIGEESR